MKDEPRVTPEKLREELEKRGGAEFTYRLAKTFGVSRSYIYHVARRHGLYYGIVYGLSICALSRDAVRNLLIREYETYKRLMEQYGDIKAVVKQIWGINEDSMGIFIAFYKMLERHIASGDLERGCRTSTREDDCSNDECVMVSVHVPPGLLEALERLVDQCRYPTRSHAIRAAIASLVERMRKTPDPSEVLDSLYGPDIPEDMMPIIQGREAGSTLPPPFDISRPASENKRRPAEEDSRSNEGGGCNIDLSYVVKEFSRRLCSRVLSEKGRIFSIYPLSEAVKIAGYKCPSAAAAIIQQIEKCIVQTEGRRRRRVVLSVDCVRQMCQQ